MKAPSPLVVLFALVLPVLAAERKPNFVVINIDDMGYADIEPFGSKLNRTPNLNRMAAEGRKLTSFYAAPVCSPSRAALMTGCYAKRALPIPHVLFPASAQALAREEVTVAEVLRSAGYSTAIIGKWHLGDHPDFLPNAQGFDLHFGLPYSNDMGPAADGVKSDLGKPLPTAKVRDQPPLPLLRNGKVVKRVLPDDQQSLVEIYTDEAVKFIAEKKSVPFFLYLPHNAVHFPIYPGKKWAGRSPHGIYSDWVEEVDWSVGRILDALKEHALAERTLVIFTSDNGGTPRAVNSPLRGFKGSTWEGGMRVPTIAWWPGKIPAGTATDAITGMFDILPTFAALSAAKLPEGRRLDGANIWPQLTGGPDAKSARETFFYFNGLRLNAVRHGDWKMFIAMGNSVPAKDAKPFKPQLYNLRADIGETNDVAAANPEVVARLHALIAAMKDDLGIEEIGPGCRALGRVDKPQPLIAHDVPDVVANAAPVLLAALKPGEKLDRAAAPQVADRAFTISCSVETSRSNAVILAHGGVVAGYALHLNGGRVAFAVRTGSDDAVTEILTPGVVTMPARILASLASNGTMMLTVNDGVPVTGKAPGPIPRQPAESFCLGYDDRQPVTSYVAKEPFTGTIKELKFSTP